MTTNTPQTLKGFRDILPAEKQKRDWVQARIIKVFAKYGFVALETPTLEYAELLLGKYGDEADKMVYTFTDRGERQVGLRYDQTVPTARILSQYAGQLPKFFRRYQIQNVFRTDKPQKGRYREFTQCDIDIFGSTSPVADAEILACTYDTFKELGFTNVQLVINDRQVLLNTLQPFANEKVTVFSIVQTIDKLDKLSEDEVTAELVAKGLDTQQASQVLTAITSAPMSDSLSEIIKLTQALGAPAEALVFSPATARGLDYYTGMIFEVKIKDVEGGLARQELQCKSGGSLGGGGRYDQLIGQLSGSADIPAVGVGLGFDRIVELADQQGLIPTTGNSAQVLISLFDQNSIAPALELAKAFRAANISTEVYPQPDKLAKQFKLADQKQIPFVAILGAEEIANNTLTIKNLKTGEQTKVILEQAVQIIKNQAL